MSKNKGELTSELNSRLDNLFSEEDDFDDEAPAVPAADVEDVVESSDLAEQGVQATPEPAMAAEPDLNKSPLIELDAIVLSLDWEITDENLDKLLAEIERLKQIYKDARLPYMFLQLHGSVGKYIASKKVDAHPDSIKLLHSVHMGLEKILLKPGMNETEKKKILSEEVKKFKGLKHQIMLTKSMDEDNIEAEPVKKTLAAATPTPPPAKPADRPEDGVALANQPLIDEIKQVIRAEFKELKAEIMSWKQGQA